jgi:hypothetical protein
LKVFEHNKSFIDNARISNLQRIIKKSSFDSLELI